MTGFDFDDIAALWKESAADEQAALQALARKARRRAKLMNYIDAALVIMVVGCVGLGAVMKPTPAAAALAVLLIVLSFWISWERRRFRQMSKALDTSDRRSFLASSIKSARANLRRATFTLATFPPVLLIGIIYRVSVRDDPAFDNALDALAAWATSPKGMFALTAISLLALWSLRSVLRAKAELRRWHEVRQAYDEEARQGDTDDR